MEIMRLQDLSYRYAGSAEGLLTTENGIAKNVSITKAGVTLAMGDRAGEKPPKPSNGMGPGALGINKNDNSYTCTGDSLKYVTEDFRGKTSQDHDEALAQDAHATVTGAVNARLKI